MVLQAQAPSIESGTLLVSLRRPVGRETYSTGRSGDGLAFTAISISRARRAASGLVVLGTAPTTPTEFSVKGKSYRFNDTAVKVAGGIATVTVPVETKSSKATAVFHCAAMRRFGARAADSLLGAPRPPGTIPGCRGRAMSDHLTRHRPDRHWRTPADLAVSTPTASSGAETVARR